MGVKYCMCCVGLKKHSRTYGLWHIAWSPAIISACFCLDVKSAALVMNKVTLVYLVETARLLRISMCSCGIRAWLKSASRPFPVSPPLCASISPATWILTHTIRNKNHHLCDEVYFWDGGNCFLSISIWFVSTIYFCFSSSTANGTAKIKSHLVQLNSLKMLMYC